MGPYFFVKDECGSHWVNDSKNIRILEITNYPIIIVNNLLNQPILLEPVANS